MENQTITKFHRRTSAPSRGERVVLRCEHHCSPPARRRSPRPRALARRLDRPPASRVEYDIGKRAPSASTEIVLFDLTADRAMVHPLILHESVIRGPRSQMQIPGAGLPINPRCEKWARGARRIVRVHGCRRIAFAICLVSLHDRRAYYRLHFYSPFPVQHPSEDEGRRRGHPMIRLGLNDPC